MHSALNHIKQYMHEVLWHFICRMVISVATLHKLVTSETCYCSEADAPDDMTLGLCLRHLGIHVTHSPLFHQVGRQPSHDNDSVAPLVETHWDGQWLKGQDQCTSDQPAMAIIMLLKEFQRKLTQKQLPFRYTVVALRPSALFTVAQLMSYFI